MQFRRERDEFDDVEYSWDEDDSDGPSPVWRVLRRGAIATGVALVLTGTAFALLDRGGDTPDVDASDRSTGTDRTVRSIDSDDLSATDDPTSQPPSPADAETVLDGGQDSAVRAASAGSPAIGLGAGAAEDMNRPAPLRPVSPSASASSSATTSGGVTGPLASGDQATPAATTVTGSALPTLQHAGGPAAAPAPSARPAAPVTSAVPIPPPAVGPPATTPPTPAPSPTIPSRNAPPGQDNHPAPTGDPASTAPGNSDHTNNDHGPGQSGRPETPGNSEASQGNGPPSQPGRPDSPGNSGHDAADGDPSQVSE